MKPLRIKWPVPAWGTLWPCACAALTVFAALDPSAAFAAGKRHIGHHRYAPDTRIPARLPTLPTGPHPSEATSKQAFTPAQR